MSAPERRRTAPAGRPSLRAVTDNPNAAKRNAADKHATDIVAKYGPQYAHRLATYLLDAVDDLTSARAGWWPTEAERDLARRYLPTIRASLAQSEGPTWTPPPARPAPPMPPRPKVGGAA